MTLDEAIKHCEEVVDSHDSIKQIKAVTLEECRCADEHRQLAEWLKDYKRLKIKEEPRMVYFYGDGYADGSIVYDGAQCPACGMDIDESDMNWEGPYCYACGQALKWTVAEVDSR